MLGGFLLGFAVCLALLIGGLWVAIKGSPFIGALERFGRSRTKSLFHDESGSLRISRGR